AYCGCLLQLSRRGDCNHTGGGNRDSRVAVGTRRAEAERHPFDASRDGLHIERPDLGGVVYSQENPAEGRRGLARISSTHRGRGRSHCLTDGAPGRLSQWGEWTWVEACRGEHVQKMIGGPDSTADSYGGDCNYAELPQSARSQSLGRRAP